MQPSVPERLSPPYSRGSISTYSCNRGYASYRSLTPAYVLSSRCSRKKPLLVIEQRLVNAVERTVAITPRRTLIFYFHLSQGFRCYAASPWATILSPRLAGLSNSSGFRPQVSVAHATACTRAFRARSGGDGSCYAYTACVSTPRHKLCRL